MPEPFGENIESERENSEKEPMILETFSWEDKKDLRGEQGATYEGVLRYASKKDREGIKAVEMDKRKYRAERGERPYAPDEDPMTEEFDQNINKPEKVLFLVLTVDGEIVAHVDFGEDYLSEPHDPKTIEIYTVATMEKYKRNGFMTRLMKQAEKVAQQAFGAEKMILSTQEENLEAINFYSSPQVGYEQLPGHFESKGEGSWNGKNPYWSVRFIKHLKPEKEK